MFIDDKSADFLLIIITIMTLTMVQESRVFYFLYYFIYVCLIILWLLTCTVYYVVFLASSF